MSRYVIAEDDEVKRTALACIGIDLPRETTALEVATPYNGWTNRETWAVALHINNDQGWQEQVHETLNSGPYGSEGFTLTEAREAFYNAPLAVERMAGELIRENVEEVLLSDDWSAGDSAAIQRQRDTLNDIGSLYRVDWDELGGNFLSALDE